MKPGRLARHRSQQSCVKNAQQRGLNLTRAAPTLSCRYAQPALFVAGLAAAEKLRADNPEAVAGCSAVAGLSLGEYTALVFAGALSFDDGLKVCFQNPAGHCLSVHLLSVTD